MVFNMSDNNIKNKQGLTEEQFLAAYDASKFERPSVTVDMLIFTVTDEVDKRDETNKTNEVVEVVEEKIGLGSLYGKALKLLMIKRGDHPCIGQWALPGGFVNMDESLEEAAYRELKEETNIDNIYMEQFYTWGDVGRDPRTRIISCSYLTLVDNFMLNRLNIKAADDADDAKWFTVSCKLHHEQKFVTGEGYKLCRRFKLSLINGDENLSAKENLSAIVETIKIKKGEMVKVERVLVESNGIAFDHGKIIQCGIESLYNEHLMNKQSVFNDDSIAFNNDWAKVIAKSSVYL